MKYRTRFKIEAQAELRKLPRPVAVGILRKLTELEQDPFAFGTTPLVGDPDIRRLRVGDYRAFYEVHGDELLILVVRAGHRSVVYDK